MKDVSTFQAPKLVKFNLCSDFVIKYLIGQNYFVCSWRSFLSTENVFRVK